MDPDRTFAQMYVAFFTSSTSRGSHLQYFRKDEFSKTLSCIIEFMCSACSVNEYHSDISKLIEKTLDLSDRVFNILIKT